jgi:putative salt-induced outer membrane protein YdiY
LTVKLENQGRLVLKVWKNVTAGAAVLALAAATAAVPARAEDKPEERKTGWFEKASFSYVATSGNSSTSTLGFSDTLKYLWPNAQLAIDASAVYAKSTNQQVAAVGSPSNFDVKDGPTTTTSEIYALGGKYSRNITDHFFWFAGLGWDRNVGAGIKNRYVGAAGVGNIWVDKDTMKWRTDYALSYTDQSNYVEPDGFDGTFSGVRVSSDFMMKWGANTTFVDTFFINESLSDSQNYYGDMVNSVAVAINKNFALKVALEWIYNNQPALKDIPLYASSGSTTSIGTVSVEADKLDSVFTTSLVINF